MDLAVLEGVTDVTLKEAAASAMLDDSVSASDIDSLKEAVETLGEDLYLLAQAPTHKIMSTYMRQRH